jgi:hypothetical protein
MTYSMQLPLLLTTLLTAKLPADLATSGPASAQPPLEEHLQLVLQQLLDLAQQFRSAPVSPQATLQFERQLQLHLRAFGRLTVQHTYNALEPADVQTLPKHVNCHGSYTRLNRKTPQNVWTLFGQVRLRRVGYRSTTKDGSPTLFPLTHSLGLIEGATPALAGQVACLFSSTGMTQGQTRQRLRQDHGVGWGVKKLREVTGALAEMLAPQRHACQVDRLLELLERAKASKGTHEPVLSAGRDGISLGIRIKKGNVFEVATTATLSVLDRAGKRLGTVYLAYVPQPEQVRMSQELTRLVRAVLERWQGALPRLCYVTDAGKCETSYYKQVLTKMRHPRTKERLEWVRVVDYYHASQRLWTMAECLFGKGPQAASWARKMQKWLKKPSGANRVLHSAAWYRSQGNLEGKKAEDFAKAYRYLSKRMKYLRYHEYKQQGVPLGSGVTEAACKTVYTQRLKLSGMRWKKPGAQVVLDLRVLLLSDVWQAAFSKALEILPVVTVPVRKPLTCHSTETAA